MAATRKIEYKGRQITITAAKVGARYVGTYEVHGDSIVTDRGPDATGEEGALDNAERAAKEAVDLLR